MRWRTTASLRWDAQHAVKNLMPTGYPRDSGVVLIPIFQEILFRSFVPFVIIGVR